MRIISGTLKGKKLIPLNDQFFKNLKFVNSDGEVFVNLILDLKNNLINEPIIFCPTVTNNESLIKEIKNQKPKQTIIVKEVEVNKKGRR